MTRSLCTGLLCLALGCGQSSAEIPPSADEMESEGAETPATDEALAEPAEPAEQAPAPAPTGPSSITVKVMIDGEPAQARVRLLAGGSEAGSGDTGQPITVDSGDYTMEVEITEGLVDKPVQTRSLTLLPGGSIEETVEFPWAKIQLKVRVNGALDRNAKVDLFRDDEVVATLKSNAPHVPISPGRYKAVVKTRGTKIEVKELMFPQGATQTVPVAVHM